MIQLHTAKTAPRAAGTATGRYRKARAAAAAASAVITCDVPLSPLVSCRQRLVVPGPVRDAAAARDAAAQRGWTHPDNHDRCPRHSAPPEDAP